MQPVPVYRRVLLLMFVLLFCILAPAAIFYTSGYRWNAKKGIVERTGTLIIDTQPVGASVFLNGDDTGEKTPITLQNLAPGSYQIQLSQQGYHSWEKTLEVRSERVTFVNDVRLWPTAEPVLRWESSIRRIAIAPNQRLLAMLEGAGTSTILMIRDVEDGSVSRITFSQAPTGDVQLRWNDRSNAVLVEDERGASWVAVATEAFGIAAVLPPAIYRWEDSDLVGSANGQRIEFSSLTGALRRTPLAAFTVDEKGSYRIMSATGTVRMSIVERGHDERRFELPEGDWTFADQISSWIFLRQNDQWLGFEPRTIKEPQVVSVSSHAAPRTLVLSRQAWLLWQNVGELWIATLGRTPQLLIRASEALKGAEWYVDGNAVFYATNREVFALALDPRDGRRQTTLGTFDQIVGIASSDQTVFVAGERNGTRGVWAIAIE